MTTPTRYPVGGLATEKVTHPLGHIGFPNPFKRITLADDFLRFDDTDEDNYNIVAATGSVALTPLEGGAILLSTTAADNDFVVVTLPVLSTPFVLRTGKKAVFSARVTSNLWDDSTATAPAIVLGLEIATGIGTPIADGGLTTTLTDGVRFFKPTTSEGFILQIENGGSITASSALTTALTNGTFVTFSWVWDGVDTVSVYIDDVKVLDQTTITNLPTTADLLSLCIAIKAGDAAVSTLTVDNVLVAFER